MRRTDAVTAAPVGSRGGFVDLYERTVTDVYSYLASRVGDRGVAEELTQDVFVVGAHRCAAGEVVDVAWLIGVARHKLVDHWRAQARNDRKLALAHSSGAGGARRCGGVDRSRSGGEGVGGAQSDLPGGVGVASR